MKKKIIVATDLTEAGSKAILQAMYIAHRISAELTLLHVNDDNLIPEAVIKNSLKQEAEKVHLISGIKCGILILHGNMFEEIALTTAEGEYCLMVIATHAIHGVRQMLLGSDILRLVMKVHIPVLVVQKKSPLINEFKQIILPVASHVSFYAVIDAVMFLALAFNAVVILYYIHKPGCDLPGQLLQNIEEASRIFMENGVQMMCIKEDQNVYSPFYAEQTLAYALQSGADCICVMSIPSKEYNYFAQSDKETLLLNENHIPILCAGGGKTEGL
jgi:nucleotide-binding universal stress UspA family protein